MVKPERVLKLNSASYTGGSVLYWMSRDIRMEDNWALLYAQELALEYSVPLMVLYNLAPGFLGGGLRQHTFKIQALKSVEAQLQSKNISFFILNGSETEKDIVDFVEKNQVGAVVTDFSPLKLPRSWVAYVRKNLSVPLYGVDAHNIVPCGVASPKQEFGAYTLRPKLYKLLPTYLEEFPPIKKHPHTVSTLVPVIAWDALLNDPTVNKDVQAVSWITGDHRSAHKTLTTFIDHGLPRYADLRNDPNENAQSNLSPYLHYGVLSAARIALSVLERLDAPVDEVIEKAKNKAKVDPKRTLSLEDHAGAYLEELIVRRELSDNFCFYNENYDSVEGFPEWAQKSHALHKEDPREYLYSDEEFEYGRTHDELWNAAEQEMLQTGKMHGYMRMYWAKKILEWTPSPEEAMRVAIYLNDKYELDGRDPNGYVGIAWSIGGVHDRAWFVRPVFGQIRYMNANGCKAKFDTKAYILRWSPKRM